MPIDPRQLRPNRNAIIDIVDSDRPCPRCDYNLRGLPINGKCPECGLPIGGRSRRGYKRFSDNLTDAPLNYLRPLAAGLVLLCLSRLTISIALMVGLRLDSLPALLLAAVATLGWWVGVYISTARRAISPNTVRDTLLDSPTLRLVNRLSQGAWTAAAVAIVAAAQYKGPVATASSIIAGLLFVVGLLGLVPLAAHFSSLADWAGDTSLAERFRISAWAIAVFGTIMVASVVVSSTTGAATGLLGVLGSFSWTAVIIAELFLTVSFIQLAYISTWAIRNAVTHMEVDRRLAARRSDPLAHQSCENCGYDLSGLDPFNSCPECGHVAESVKHSGLFGLRQARHAAENADTSPLPLQPEGKGPRKAISTPAPIEHPRRRPPEP